MISDDLDCMLMEIILMVGIAGSGKSTLARKIFPRHIHVSLDVIKQWSRISQKKILDRYSRSPGDTLSKRRKIEHVLMTDALEKGQNVIVDDTNLTRKIRRRHVDLDHPHALSQSFAHPHV